MSNHDDTSGRWIPVRGVVPRTDDIHPTSYQSTDKPPSPQQRQAIHDKIAEAARVDIHRTSQAAALQVLSGREEDVPHLFVKDVENLSPFSPDRTSVLLPNLEEGFSASDLTALRGVSDRAAFRLRHSDPDIFKNSAPINPDARDVIDVLEQLRCETLGAEQYAGAAKNMRESLTLEFNERAQDLVPGAHQDSLKLGAYFVFRELLSGEVNPAALQSNIEAWKDQFAPYLTDDMIDALKDSMHDQALFAHNAREVLSAMGLDVELPEMDSATESDEEAEANDEQSDDQNQDKQSDQMEASDDDAEAEQKDSDERSEDEEQNADGPSDGSEKSQDAELGEAGEDGDAPENGIEFRQVHAPETPKKGYRIFTTEFDEVIKGQDYLNSLDQSWRNRLNEQFLEAVHSQTNAHSRLANKLQRQLLSSEFNLIRGERDLEEGILDVTRLSRVVTDPMNPRAFKSEDEYELKDTVVTLLIDNSGSMRGRPIELALKSAYLLAQVLERCKIKTEILGFTTTHWGKAGMVHQAWSAAGKPSLPGRLNALRHIIYKSADEPLRRARQNMSAMLHGEMLRENIDGEALLWAEDRLLKRPEKRKILIPISDGMPVDSDTISNNEQGFLEDHLKEVIQRIEGEGRIEMSAIGIGHDVGKFYSHAVTINDPNTLADTLFDQISTLFRKPSAAEARKALRQKRMQSLRP